MTDFDRYPYAGSRTCRRCKQQRYCRGKNWESQLCRTCHQETELISQAKAAVKVLRRRKRARI